jgi:hypothetical protein
MEEGLVDIRQPFVANVEPSEAMQPCQRAFDDPAGAAEAAAMRAIPPGEHGRDAAPPELGAMPLRVVPAIALDASGFRAGGPGPTANRGQVVDQRQQFTDVVVVGGGQMGDEGHAARVGQNVMFRPVLTAIGGVRSSFFPPRGARRDALSTTARSRSSWPRRRSSVSSAVWIRRQTPACCHASSRRRQVLPEPQPISSGNICHGRPLRRTNKIPVSTARSGRGRRPARWPFPRRRFGINGSIRRHRASSIRRFDMPDRTKSVRPVQER